jgi:hypothetical protein
VTNVSATGFDAAAKGRSGRARSALDRINVETPIMKVTASENSTICLPGVRTRTRDGVSVDSRELMASPIARRTNSLPLTGEVVGNHG